MHHTELVAAAVGVISFFCNDLTKGRAIISVSRFRRATELQCDCNWCCGCWCYCRNDGNNYCNIDQFSSHRWPLCFTSLYAIHFAATSTEEKKKALWMQWNGLFGRLSVTCTTNCTFSKEISVSMHETQHATNYKHMPPIINTCHPNGQPIFIHFDAAKTARETEVAT